MDSNNLKLRSEGSKSSKEYDIIGFAKEGGSRYLCSCEAYGVLSRWVCDMELLCSFCIV